MMKYSCTQMALRFPFHKRKQKNGEELAFYKFQMKHVSLLSKLITLAQWLVYWVPLATESWQTKPGSALTVLNPTGIWLCLMITSGHRRLLWVITETVHGEQFHLSQTRQSGSGPRSLRRTALCIAGSWCQVCFSHQ